MWTRTGGKYNAAEDAPAHGRQHAGGRKGSCRQVGLCRELPADYITPGGPGAAGARQRPALPGLPGFPARTRCTLVPTLPALLDAALQGSDFGNSASHTCSSCSPASKRAEQQHTKFAHVDKAEACNTVSAVVL